MRIPASARRIVAWAKRPTTRQLYGRKRARSAVWLGLAGFIGGTIFLNVLLDTSRAQYRDPEFAWHARHTARRVAREPSRPLGIVLGTSRSQMGFSPVDLGLPDDPASPMVSNFAQSRSVPVYSLMNLRRILAQGFRPAFVLYEIMPSVLVADNPSEHFIPADRMSYADTRAVKDFSEDQSGWYGPRIAPLQTYRNHILAHHLPNWLPVDENKSWVWTRPDPCGWLPIGWDDITQAMRDAYMAPVHDTYMQSFNSFAVAPRMDKAIREVLQLCRERGIPVALYRMPESPIFRSWYSPGTREKVDAYIATLRHDYDVPWFDCSEWLVETDFLDGHHTLRPGAKKFSRRFGAECLMPWLEDLKRKGIEFPPSGTP